ncbi:MAG: hypothetical protein ACI4W1_07850 [Ruminococcus sp.]
MTAKLIEKEQVEYLNAMKEYIDMIKAMPKEDAEQFCLESLIHSGVLDEDGNEKEQICSL